MTRTFASVLWIFSLALFASSAALADRNDRLYIELKTPGPTPEATHYNWYRSDADFWRGAAQGLLEPLFHFNESDGSLSGWLARKYTIAPDGLSATIWVKPEARWSNGDRLTAFDIAFSIGLVKANEALDGPHTDAIRELVRSVEAPNRFRVEITFGTSSSDFLENHFSTKSGLAFPIVSRRKWAEIVDPAGYGNPSPLGSGPYTLDGFDAGSGAIAWSRHNRWWGHRTGWRPLPAPARLFWLPPEDTRERRVRGITGGRIDSAMSVSFGSLQGMQAVTDYVGAWPNEANGEDEFLPYSFLFWSGWPTEPVRNWPRNQQVQLLIHRLQVSPLNQKN